MAAKLTIAECYELWSNNASFEENFARNRMATVIDGFVRADGMVDVADDLLGAMGVSYRGTAHLVAAFGRELGLKVTSNKAQTVFRFARV